MKTCLQVLIGRLWDRLSSGVVSVNPFGRVNERYIKSIMENCAMGRRTVYLAGAIALCSIVGAPSAHAQLRQGGTSNANVFSACPDSVTAPQTISTPCLAIAQFETGTSPAQRQAYVRQSGAVLRFNYGILNAAAVLIPNARSYQILAGQSNVLRLIPDRRVQAFKGKPGGGGGGGGSTSQTVPAGVQHINADQVWNNFNNGSCCTGSGVVVAVLDTGLDLNHADLAGNIIGGATCLGASDYPDVTSCAADGGMDDEGHGTHVGGIIAAMNNSVDVVGVAPKASLYSVKVLDSTGSGYDSNIIAGLDWVATQTSARVVNMSLGRPGSCLDPTTDPSADAIRTALQVLKGMNISIVVAAGNDASAEVKDMVPAGCPEVMAVASTTAKLGSSKCRPLPAGIPADTASYFTTDGAMDSNGVGVTISAPGETQENNTCATIQSDGIESLALGGGTIKMSGTSMASPHVAGVAALMLEANPNLCPDGVRQILRQYAQNVGFAPYPNPYIAGSPDGELEGILDASTVIGKTTNVCPSS
jgi:subtilisin